MTRKSTIKDTVRPPSLTPGQRLRIAREEKGLSCAQAGALVDPPISGQSWGDAERGSYRTLDWWYSAAVAIGVNPHSLDPRLVRQDRESSKKKGTG